MSKKATKKTTKTTKATKKTNDFLNERFWSRTISIWIVAIVLISVITGVITYQVQIKEKAAMIEQEASHITVANEELANVSEEAVEILSYSNNKEWRLESLTNEEVKKEEFGTFLDACIYDVGCEEDVIAKVDEKSDSLKATSYAPKEKITPIRNVASTITLEYSFEYELLSKNENLLSAEEFQTMAYESLMEFAVVIASVTFVITSVLSLVALIVVIKRKA